MAGQTIEFPNGQVHKHDRTACHPNSAGKHITSESSYREAHGAKWDVMGIKSDDLRYGERFRRNTDFRSNRPPSFATVPEMYASIVHQLRQPLTSMLADAQAAKRWLAAEPPNLIETLGSIDRIARCAHAADETLGRIRALFGQESLNKREVSIFDVMDDVMTRLIHEYPHKREIPIDWHSDEDLPNISVDPVPIQELFINLISNAIEAVEGSTITPLVKIRASVTDSNEMLVQVIDNGPGVHDTEKIFDAFMTTKDKGMGIGLAVSRSIVEAHCGRLWAENNPDGGAKFNVALPLS